MSILDEIEYFELRGKEPSFYRVIDEFIIKDTNLVLVETWEENSFGRKKNLSSTIRFYNESEDKNLPHTTIDAYTHNIAALIQEYQDKISRLQFLPHLSMQRLLEVRDLENKLLELKGLRL